MSGAGRRLILMRHGRTAWNATGRAQGHADIEIDELGHEQAAAAAPYLASLGPVALWCSDLARARQTCAYLEKHTGLTATYDARLREFDVGARQGLTMPEFEEAFPEAYALWRQGTDAVRLPGAEGDADVVARMVPALRECLDSLAPGETGIVVTHGACLKVALLGLLGWDQGEAPALQGVANCAWVWLEELEAGGRLRLVSYNESVRPGHAAPLAAPDEV
ncbi:MAG: histidine phosphatase family protein [Nocardioidaceae bacterium]